MGSRFAPRMTPATKSKRHQKHLLIMFREGVVFRSVFTRQLFDLSDEMATKLDIEFYKDGRDALPKALAD